jgi:hypothetical protein
MFSGNLDISIQNCAHICDVCNFPSILTPTPNGEGQIASK